MSNKTEYLKVSDMSGHDLPAIGRIRHSVGTFYLVVTIDDQIQWTTAIKQSNDPKWSDKLYFDMSIVEEGLLNVQIYLKHTASEDHLVGELNAPLKVSTFLGNEDKKIIQESIYQRDENNRMLQAQGSIELTLLRIIEGSKLPSIDAQIEGAKNAVKAMSKHPKAVKFANMLRFGASTGTKKIQGTYDVWKPLVVHINIFVKIVDEISEIHPYSRLAWSVLSLPLKAIIAQSKRDKKIQDLLESMNDIYSYVVEAGPLKLVKSHKRTIQLMCQQTAECAFFIRDYTSRNFGERMVKSMMTDYSGKVDAYQQKFKQLKEDFNRNVMIATAITVYQIANKIDNIDSTQKMDGMHYASTLYRPDPCLVGTRENIIRNIIKWFSRPVGNDDTRVYWLSGVAGCGKSSVARSVADQLAAQHRCVSFFFHASTKTESGPDRLFATISRDLTEWSDGWKSSLVKILESISIRGCSTIEEQFENFIVRPAAMLDNIGPMLIVIDALDESGTVQERQRLLEILKSLPKLPPYFRFLITSRPEKDITFVLDQKPWVHRFELHDADAFLTEVDIEYYVRNTLHSIPELEKANIDIWTRGIVARSGRLFQWAATACRYIRGKGLIDDDPTARVTEVVNIDAFDGLDTLYLAILDRLSEFHDGDISSRRFQTIMGRALLVREPMSMKMLSSFWYDDEDKDRVKKVLSPLGSLLSGVLQEDEPVQPLHVSFTDFLTTKDRSGKYWIDVEGQHERLAYGLLRDMKLLLRFNICNLTTSYTPNSEIEDLDKRIAENIPRHLDYACCNWVDHLTQFPVTHEWVNRVDEFMRSYLLFWFEAMSLMGKTSIALNQLIKLQNWLTSLGDIDDIQLFIHDAYQFGRAYGHIMQHNTPHLYLSLLPFVPRDSLVSRTYLPQYPGCITIIDEHKITWPQVFLSINVTSPVYSVAFSFDGKRFASGSDDGAVRIWNADTGELVAGPFQGHAGGVTSVAFSADGKRVVSSSDDTTVRIWNADTGELIAGPFQGHTGEVTSVAFSANGKRVVSGSSDTTVRIWNADTGELVTSPFQGHTSGVTSVEFSADGKQVVSGSSDTTVRIWNADTGELVAGPFQGHTDWVRSVAFSADGKRVVSGSNDTTVRIWNAETGELVAGPFQGHTDWVRSVAFSADGKRVVSGSDDATVRIWNADTGELIAGPFQGHTDWVTSVEFSADNKRVVSSSSDTTVRIWNADTGKLVTGPFQGHTGGVTSVEFSADGKRVVSGSDDTTIRIWDTDTGKLVAGPFQGHTDWVRSVAFSADGKRIVSGSSDTTVRIWNADTGELVAGPFQGHTDWVRSVAFSADGKRVVSGSSDTTVRIWNADTGKLVAGPFQGHTREVTSVAFSADGKRVVSGSYDTTIIIWNANTGELIAGPFQGHTRYITSVGFSADSKRVVSGSSDTTVRIWNTDTGELVAGPFQGHTDWVRSVAFSADGKRVVSGSYDTTVRIWNADTGELVAGPFQGHTSGVTSVGFSANSKRVVSGSSDTTVRIWNADTEDNTTRIWHSKNASNPLSNDSFVIHTNVYQTFVPGFQYSNGWILSGALGNEYLFWTPEQLHPDIVSPNQDLLIGARNPLCIDIRNLAHGDKWTECHRPFSLSQA